MPGVVKKPAASQNSPIAHIPELEPVRKACLVSQNDAYPGVQACGYYPHRLIQVALSKQQIQALETWYQVGNRVRDYTFFRDFTTWQYVPWNKARVCIDNYIDKEDDPDWYL